MKKNYFTKNIESLIDPIEVGTIHFMQSYAKSLPISLQYNMVRNGAKKNPYMGFVVEPYSFFLCYQLKDLEWAKKLIPDNYALIKTKIFETDEPNYYCIFGNFNIHTSAFWGTRMEFSIIAQNKESGLLSWIIIDYATNTIGFDEKNGLNAGNTSKCIFTTNYNGEVIVDIRGKKDNLQLIVDSPLCNGQEFDLHPRLWVEGNLSVAYGRELSKNKGDAFSVTFNPKEVARALKIPLEDVNIETNTWYPGLFHESPSSIACFPFAQHYLSDSPGHYSKIKNEKELLEIANNLNFDTIPRYSSQSIKKAFQVGQLISLTVIIILTIFLILKW